MFCARCGEQIPDASEICPICGREANVKLLAPAFPISTPAQVGHQPPLAVASGPNGVGGWLLLFCVVLTILSPLGMMPQIASLTSRLDPIRLINLISVPYGMAVGILLWMRRPTALNLLRVYLIMVSASAVSGVLGLVRVGLLTGWTSLPFSPNFTPLLIRPAIVILWFCYFHKSRRVRNTYGANL